MSNEFEPPSIFVDPNEFTPVEFGRVLVTRMLTNTNSAWAETGDIAFYEKKGELAFHLAGLAAQLVEHIAITEQSNPLEWWQELLAKNVPTVDKREENE